MNVWNVFCLLLRDFSKFNKGIMMVLDCGLMKNDIY